MAHRVRIIGLACIGALFLAAPVRGQDDNTVAVGVSFSARAADSSIAHGGKGIGLAWRFGHGRTGWGVLGGLAFVSFRQTPAAVDVYRDRLGARALNFDASDTFVVRPQTNLWIDVSKKVGVNVSAGYMVARPRLTVRSSLGEESRRLRADMVVLSAGLVYKIF